MARLRLLNNTDAVAYNEGLLALKLSKPAQNKPKSALSPQDALPFWEMERLRKSLEEKKRCLMRFEQGDVEGLETYIDIKFGLEGTLLANTLRLGLKQARLKVDLYQRAFDQCTKECATLHPGMTFAEVTGRRPSDELRPGQSREEIMFNKDYFNKRLPELKEWLQRVPDKAALARTEVQMQIKDAEEVLCTIDKEVADFQEF